MPQGEVVADFTDYQAAVAFVENLIAHNFPAGAVAIVGSDLRTVERVRAKLSYAKVALGGATTGAWLGLIIGLIFGPGVAETSNADQLTGVESAFSAVLIGAGIGMLFNVIRFALARTKRGFISVSSVVASKYQVQVPGDLAEQAKGIPVHEH
jgi:hypothetical protein